MKWNTYDGNMEIITMGGLRVRHKCVNYDDSSVLPEVWTSESMCIYQAKVKLKLTRIVFCVHRLEVYFPMLIASDVASVRKPLDCFEGRDK